MLVIREARADDGADLWRMVDASGALEQNTPYCYLMMSKLFSKTCLVAENKGKPVGFVMAFVPPEKPRTAFVWQIATMPEMRGQGLATKLLDELVERNDEVDFIEASVTPDNAASLGLFRRWADRRGAERKESTFLAADDFPKPHEKELLLRLGPVSKAAALV